MPSVQCGGAPATHQLAVRGAAAVGQRFTTPALLPVVAGPVGGAVATRRVRTVCVLAALQGEGETQEGRAATAAARRQRQPSWSQQPEPCTRPEQSACMQGVPSSNTRIPEFQTEVHTANPKSAATAFPRSPRPGPCTWAQWSCCCTPAAAAAVTVLAVAVPAAAPVPAVAVLAPAPVSAVPAPPAAAPAALVPAVAAAC